MSENVICENKNNVLTIQIKGKVSSDNANQIEKEINTCLENSHESVVLDLQDLSYLSSAGLRVVLRLRKAEPTLEVINVCSDVYEIFDMTGFTEMMPIKKAYRVLSVEGCEVIGEGANGKVYRLDPDTIIKVYRDSDALPAIHRERELARKAFVLGIPTAIPYDVVKVGDTYGSVFELLNAKSFAKLIQADSEHLDHYVQLYIDLLHKIHSTEVNPKDMPDMKEEAIGWVKLVKDYLPEEKYAKLLALVEAVPTRYTMLHGDYHIKNVMMQNDEVLLIDMDTLCYGHPIFELVPMFNAYIGYGELNHDIITNFLGVPYETTVEIWYQSLRKYFNTDDEEKIKSIDQKARLLSYTRLMRRSIRKHGPHNEEAEFYQQCIEKLLDVVDTLDFE